MTIIKINGGFWGWEPIETLERLYPLFEQYTLDPIYEWYGNFVNRKPEWQRSEERQAYQGCTVISGRFLHYGNFFYIVILDEATASVDPENEHLIQQALSALTKGKTILTIAHRLATIQHADQILVVEDGRIAQRGTHAELMAQGGLYRRFIEIREQAEGWRLA